MTLTRNVLSISLGLMLCSTAAFSETLQEACESDQSPNANFVGKLMSYANVSSCDEFANFAAETQTLDLRHQYVSTEHLGMVVAAFPKLKELLIENVSDFAPFENHQTLETLRIYKSTVHSPDDPFAIFSTIPNLNTLHLINVYEPSYISTDWQPSGPFDVRPLCKLSNVKHLILNGSDLHSYECLKELTQLETFGVGFTDVEDISYIADMVNLRELWIHGLKLNDSHLDVLEKLSELRILRAYSNQISDLSKLAHLSKLETLTLQFNPITNFDALKNFPNLTLLDLSSTGFSDLSLISGFTKMQMLGLNSNGITDPSPISQMLDLKRLWIENNQISSLDFLSQLKSIEWLNIKRNLITDMTILNDLPNLVELLWTGNPDSNDVCPLANPQFCRN